MYTPLSVAAKLRRGDVLSLLLHVLRVTYLFFSFPQFTVFYSPPYISLLSTSSWRVRVLKNFCSGPARKGENESRICGKDSISEGQQDFRIILS